MFYLDKDYKLFTEDQKKPKKEGRNYYTCIHCKQEFSVYSTGNCDLNNTTFDTCIGCNINLKKDILNADKINECEEKEEKT